MVETNVMCGCGAEINYLKNMERIINKGAGQSQHFADVWYQELELYSCPSCKTIYPKIAKERKVQPFGDLKRI